MLLLSCVSLLAPKSGLWAFITKSYNYNWFSASCTLVSDIVLWPAISRTSCHYTPFPGSRSLLCSVIPNPSVLLHPDSLPDRARVTVLSLRNSDPVLWVIYTYPQISSTAKAIAPVPQTSDTMVVPHASEPPNPVLLSLLSANTADLAPRWIPSPVQKENRKTPVAFATEEPNCFTHHSTQTQTGAPQTWSLRTTKSLLMLTSTDGTAWRMHCCIQIQTCCSPLDLHPVATFRWNLSPVKADWKR